MLKKSWLLVALVLVFAFTLTACGGGESDSGEGGPNPANGEKLYKQTVIGAASAPGCITCHSLEPDTVLVGPSHAGLASRAGQVVPGQSAEAYLRESIVNPNAHITDGFQPGVMYQNFANDLSDQQIDDIVAFLLTLK